MRLFTMISLVTFTLVYQLLVRPTSHCQLKPKFIITEIPVSATGMQTIGSNHNS